MRNNARNKLIEIFKLHFEKYEKYAINAEKGIYNYTISPSHHISIPKAHDSILFRGLYIQSAYKVISNLTHKDNGQNVIQRIKDGNLLPQHIVTTHHYDLYPALWEPYIKETLTYSMVPEDNSGSTDMFKCGKCHKRNCSYYQLQTRSADEPMTTFVTCKDCGNRWKFC